MSSTNQNTFVWKQGQYNRLLAYRAIKGQQPIHVFTIAYDGTTQRNNPILIEQGQYLISSSLTGMGCENDKQGKIRCKSFEEGKALCETLFNAWLTRMGLQLAGSISK